MKSYLILLLVVAACTNQKPDTREKLSLAGGWKFRIDSLDTGITSGWNNASFEDSVLLPGSMAGNMKGDEVTVNTPWTGEIVDKSYFTGKKYEKYRQAGSVKIPFWLKPVKYYKGPAWYRKDFELPSSWNGKNISLFLERVHWESTVFVNGKKAGTENSLSTPHVYDITGLLVPGKNSITIRVDNRMIVAVGVNSHSVSDHTQSNWNGIVGDISLRASSAVFIRSVDVFPDVEGKKARVVAHLVNKSGKPFSGKLLLEAESSDTTRKTKLKPLASETSIGQGLLDKELDFPMGDNPETWSEFNPVLYKLSVSLKDENGVIADTYSTDFGMREFKTENTRFTVNGKPVFLRGTLECCIFPLTGYPPTDTGSWLKVLHTFKDYGINTVRFHSWCPPEAAFEAADRLGLYFHVECASWANSGTAIGNGAEIDRFIYTESDRIVGNYGNHPSFCMLAYGNEPAGNRQAEYLGDLLKYWRSKDNRRVYTSGAGWPFIPENDYNLSPEPRIQRWGEGLKSIINGQPPQTVFDFREYVSRFSIPVVSHEIGQWCVYPDFKEIAEYTGVLKATNLEIFRETLAENNMAGQAEDFLVASGKLQALCYKAEIEAALRTPGFAGFHLLQLHDFPGQGTALVGILNPFFRSKGYIAPEEFRMFCNSTVPLARMEKMVYTNDETFSAGIEIASFEDKPLTGKTIKCTLSDEKGQLVRSVSFRKDTIDNNNCIPVGTFSSQLSGINTASCLNFEVAVENSPYHNKWKIWVYPAGRSADPGKVVITDRLGKTALAELSRGGSVLLLTHGKIAPDKGAKVAIGFSPVFWNTAWTNNQPPHTLGILCNPEHPVFSQFPTSFHSDYQWWDPVTRSQAMILNGFPASLRPLIQPIDTWFENRRLALAFECRAGGGKLFVCSIDLDGNLDDRPASRQLLKSILDYMNGTAFNPGKEIDLSLIQNLTN